MGSRSRGPEGVSQGVGRVPDPGLLGGWSRGLFYGVPLVYTRARGRRWDLGAWTPKYPLLGTPQRPPQRPHAGSGGGVRGATPLSPIYKGKGYHPHHHHHHRYIITEVLLVAWVVMGRAK